MLSNVYSVSDLVKAFRRPSLIFRELNRLYHSRLRLRNRNPMGVEVLDEDWDNLIILDACRLDVFEEHSSLPGTTEWRYSRGSTTTEFLRTNFSGRSIHDTVYLSSNGWYFKLEDELQARFHYSEHVPDMEELTETVDNLRTEFPDKRVIAHYLPPHRPYVGETAERVFSEQPQDMFNRMMSGELNITDHELRQAYVETFQSVIPEVEFLLHRLRGKTVVTSDHGELLGDTCRPIPISDYGHYSGLYVDPLVKVPWHIVKGERRKSIRADEPRQVSSGSSEELDKHLRDLGYMV